MGRLSEQETDAIVRDLRNLLDASDLGRQFFDKLQGGVSFDGENLRLIDYEKPENNIFEIVTELPCKSGTDSFRPDITLFVNGLPLAFVEVKIPDNKHGIQAGHDRINWRFAQEKYRRFTNITQIMVFSNNSEYDDSEAVPLTGAFYAASDYTRLFFSRFREEDETIYQRLAPLSPDMEDKILRDTNYAAIKSTPEYETNKSPLSPTNRILTSLFSRERFLFLLRYAFAYVERTTAEGVKTLEKHVMRYPQFFATIAMRGALAVHGRAGDRRPCFRREYLPCGGVTMWREIGRKLCISALLLLLAFLLLDISFASAQERMYEISEEELTQLEENLRELSNVNDGQREKLTNLQEMLKTSEMRLEASERNSRMLSVKLDWLSKELTEQTSSLENANRLLKEYEEEERRTKRRVERQRNIAYVLAAIAVIFCAVK
ncbi:MAG: hypothetical protein J6Z82_08965 [Schwartzia sp.]|nr:hypothetical protein [Schwartzia sp. (in: firmicutes)]